MSRMLARVRPSHCPVCRCPPGPDCPDVGRDKRRQRRVEARQVAREIREETE